MTSENAKRRPKRVPKRLGPADLKSVALDHLDRFASSKQRLRQVVQRRIRASCRAHGDDPEPLFEALDQLVLWLEKKGLLSDRAYAESKARALHGRGTSRSRIRANLATKGIGEEDAKAAIDRLGVEHDDPELEAAGLYAKRRRLGPYRRDLATRRDHRQRDLAAMARAGFSLDIARKVIDG